jgi:hypothetical protein
LPFRSNKKAAGPLALSCDYPFFYYWPLLPPEGQPGMWGPHVGTGKVSVADWWFPIACVEEEEIEAAAAPAITTDNAKMRTASFMMS